MLGFNDLSEEIASVEAKMPPATSSQIPVLLQINIDSSIPATLLPVLQFSNKKEKLFVSALNTFLSVQKVIPFNGKYATLELSISSF